MMRTDTRLQAEFAALKDAACRAGAAFAYAFSDDAVPPARERAAATVWLERTALTLALSVLLLLV